MDMCPTTVLSETVYGSVAFNLARPGSDLDIRGVVVGPRSWYYGYAAAPEQIERTADDVQFEVRKFFRLAVAANPTMLEILWTDARHHRQVSSAGRRLLEARALFLSRRVGDTFAGYARSQLSRIRTHRQWLLDPPSAAPTRREFGLPDQPALTSEQRGAAEALFESGEVGLTFSTNFLAVLDQERRYRAAKQHFEQYQHWLRNRNAARAELEQRFGYDTKHAMHLIRLQRMAREALEHGELRVHREDRDELLAIRDGAWSFDELMRRCDDLASAIHRAMSDSVLRESPDETLLGELCADLIQEVLDARS
ncbi:MAG: nucleotidyltransferase domain-containing protein [bacterium]|nr:nucleotidyltransferase domain-containing protein [bacterium]